MKERLLLRVGRRQSFSNQMKGFGGIRLQIQPPGICREAVLK